MSEFIELTDPYGDRIAMRISAIVCVFQNNDGPCKAEVETVNNVWRVRENYDAVMQRIEAARREEVAK